MKPAPFRYARAGSLTEAIALLVAGPGDAKVLAGGQSLVPMLNMRLVRPTVLVDVNGLGELTGITATPEGGLRIGALTRHAELAASPVVIERAPLLAEAARHVGHAAIRNQGTLGGSLAHADPAAELPAALLALDARVRMTGPRGAREVAADAFFRGLLTTALEADEILTAIEVPAQPPGWGFVEIARRPGDFALAGVAAVLRAGRALTLPSPPRGGEGAPEARREMVRLVGFGVGDRPLRLTGAERVVAGAPLDAATAARAGAAAGPDCDPPSDVHGSADYRRHLATVLAERALLQAGARLAGRP
jgi:CO/xanthine dehydrogenase FAD-binding subunit